MVIWHRPLLLLVHSCRAGHGPQVPAANDATISSLLSARSSGLRISPLPLGTMIFGDSSWGADEETSLRIIERYLAAGGNSLDTANAYAAGRSEEVIGRYLAGPPGLRDRLVIATKFAGNMFPGDPNGGGAGRKAVMQQVDNSLRRPGPDYIDLFS